MQPVELDSAVHHPHFLSAVAHLKCSCGYDGLVDVNEIVVNGESDDVAKCPNCGSQTVHPKHVTELPTTIHQYTNGTTETLVAEVAASKASPTPVSVPTPDDINRMISNNPILLRLDAFLNSQKPTPVTTNTNSTEGGV